MTVSVEMEPWRCRGGFGCRVGCVDGVEAMGLTGGAAVGSASLVLVTA
ncbi:MULTISPECIES: hypothetical protein [Nocardiaceae]|uniref:Uncharacterized protein n=1 Tax=Rhodococcoides kroppenstedtii TaxID=293050 RepID=A0ABS7NVI5_9NOCA|nr:hypothetical protein [Rhodococcus sp. PBTS 1]MBY6321415.1 hypothetical protein [Rhodococcus kroppenstedtii]